MVYFITLELLLILSYLYKQMALGIIIWLLIVAFLYKRKKSTLDFLVKCLIASIPVSYLEITCEIGFHIFKLYNFTVLLIVLFFIRVIQKERMKVNKSILLAFLLIMTMQLVRTMMCNDLPSAFIELLQEYITVFPVGLLLIYSKNLKQEIETQVDASEWLDLYYYTIIAVSIGVLYQFMIYMLSGVRIGFTTIWQGRQVFDLLFTGYSVLTVFIGGGMLIAVSKLLDGKKAFENMLILLLTGLACAINSSRSGLFSAIIVIIFLFVLAIFKKRSLRYVLFYGFPVIILITYVISFLVRHRQSLQIGGLLFANNRDVVAQLAVDQMSNNIGFILFGTGINGAKIYGISQHNMFLEMWTLNGSIFLFAFVILIISLLYITRNKSRNYLFWHILIGHQFISSFFATTFIVPILFIVLCSEDNKHIYTRNKKASA